MGRNPEKPLILHVRASNFFGGPEKQILGHIAHSSNCRHCVFTYVEGGKPNEFLDRCRAANIRTEVLETRHPFAPRVIPDLRKSLKRLKPAIICSHGYKPAVLCTIARVGLRTPLIAFARGHTHETLRIRLFEFLERLCFRTADIVVAVSQGYADWLISRGIGQDHVQVVRNAIEIADRAPDAQRVQAVRRDLSCSANTILVATAGRLSPEKGHADLIRAFARVRPRFPNVRLLIIGDGPLRPKLEGLVRELSAEGIEFLGFRRDLQEILPAVDLFVLPSLSEGLPNVVLEAYAARKAVVATAVGGIPEVVQDGISGLLVPPGEPECLASAIERCIADHALAERMGRCGHDRIRQDFTFSAQARILEGLYGRLVPACGQVSTDSIQVSSMQR